MFFGEIYVRNEMRLDCQMQDEHHRASDERPPAKRLSCMCKSIHIATNGATSEGIAKCHCAVYLTLSLTPVPTRDRRVYVSQSKRQFDARQQSDEK